MILQEISLQLQAGKAKAVCQLVQQAIDEGMAADTILNQGLLAGMEIVGQKFKAGTVFVPEVLVAARAMNKGAELLKPLLVTDGMPSAGKVCIGTVKGDLHDIGKNLVASMLEGSGFEVINVGIDVDAQAFVDAVRDNQADILCLSALLTTTMTYMTEILDALKEAGIRDKVKVMVGGAPVSQDFADEIGADGYSSNANEAVALAKSLMGK